MRIPFQLHLEIDILAATKAYAAEQRVSMTRLISECLCQFLGLKGLLDPVLKAAIEERITKRPGRPVDPEKKAKREALAAEEQARVYAAAGVDPRAAEAGVAPPDPATGMSPLEVEFKEGMAPHVEAIEESIRKTGEDLHGKVKDYYEGEPSTQDDNSSDAPTPGPPIFKPETTTERLENIVSAPHPICLRCMEVVRKCECAEGAEEG